MRVEIVSSSASLQVARRRKEAPRTLPLEDRRGENIFQREGGAGGDGRRVRARERTANCWRELSNPWHFTPHTLLKGPSNPLETRTATDSQQDRRGL